MSDEINTVTLTDGEQSQEQVQQVEQQQGSEATAGQEVGQQTDQQQDDGTQKKEPWFQKRIGELTRDKYEARRAADQAAQENAELRRQLAEGRQGEQQQQQQPTDVRAEAQRLVAEERFNEACNKVYDEGTKEFKNFDSAVKNLQMVGSNREFLELVATSDAGHKLIAHLGAQENLDDAARILAMPPTQMARELTKLEIKLAQPVAKPVSKAPAPITPLGSGKATGEGLSDDLPIDEWMRRNAAQRR